MEKKVPTQEEINQKTADALTENVINLEVDIKPVNKIHALLIRWKLKPEKKVLSIKGVTLGALIRISKLLIDIDLSVFDVDNMLESNYNAITRHCNSCAHILAIAILNKREDVAEEEKLKNFILTNFTSKELLKAFQIVMHQMDITSFMSSIISVKGMNIMKKKAEMSLQSGELIASGQQSEAQ